MTPKRSYVTGMNARTILASTFPGLVAECGKRCNAIGLIVFGMALLYFCTQEISDYGWTLKQWDMLLISGLVTFLAGVWIAQQIPNRLAQALTRLANRGALEGSHEQLDQFKRFLEDRVTLWSAYFSLVSALAILIAFLVAFRGRFTPENIFLTGLEVYGGYLAGFHLGRMAFYGQLGALLQQNNIRISDTA